MYFPDLSIKESKSMDTANNDTLSSQIWVSNDILQ